MFWDVVAYVGGAAVVAFLVGVVLWWVGMAVHSIFVIAQFKYRESQGRCGECNNPKDGCVCKPLQPSRRREPGEYPWDGWAP